MIDTTFGDARDCFALPRVFVALPPVAANPHLLSLLLQTRTAAKMAPVSLLRVIENVT